MKHILKRFWFHLRLFYWRRIRHLDCIGFYYGVPIIRSKYLEPDNDAV